MQTESLSTNYQDIENICHKDRSRKELYLTLEFEGATMYDKALAGAELAQRDFWDRMKVTVAGAFFGTLFGAFFGAIVGRMSGAG